MTKPPGLPVAKEISIKQNISGARDRNRTGTLVLGATDFKSVVSTNFTTRAIFRLHLVQPKY